MQVKQIVEEVKGSAEISRRALAKKRFDIYKDGGKSFLIEQLTREFDEASIKEMRIVPLNLLKKIVNKLGSVYNVAPTRTTTDAKDKALVDYYVENMSFNQLMQKLNRYLVLASNVPMFIRPDMEMGCLKGSVLPNYLYSIVPNAEDQCKVEAFVLSTFIEEGIVAPDSAQASATGMQGYEANRQAKVSGDLVASNERLIGDEKALYVFWTKDQHFTATGTGTVLMDPGAGDMEHANPIGMQALVNVARDRDNEPWATQGEDLIDLTMALQLGWSDIMTIAKHQGYALLTITSEDQPKKMNYGINKAIWLKSEKDAPIPTIDYVSSSASLDQYKGMLVELLALMLSTNEMEPGSIGSAQVQNFTSGFHALIAKADSIGAIEADKPVMLKAERQIWQVMKAWHNWMFDNKMLNDELAKLGKFSDGFKISVQFAEIKPLESESDRLDVIERLDKLGLATRLDMMKRLNPDMTDDDLNKKLAEIDAEKESNIAAAQAMFAPKNPAVTPANPQDIQGVQNGNQIQAQKNQAQTQNAPNA